jgi:hypothetical protein
VSFPDQSQHLQSVVHPATRHLPIGGIGAARFVHQADDRRDAPYDTPTPILS